MHADYHDYVIKDGRFIGRFEEMYQDCEDPWHQAESYMTYYSKMCTVASLNRIKAKKAMEIGSGLGYYTDFLQRICPEIKFMGMDISETAVKRARENFENIEFICDNVNNIDNIVVNSEKTGGALDALIFSEIMWYILDDLDDVVLKLRKAFAGRYVIVNQTFYRGGQKYGREYFTNQDEMIKRFGFECVCKLHEERTKENAYDTHTVLLVK